MSFSVGIERGSFRFAATDEAWGLYHVMEVKEVTMAFAGKQAKRARAVRSVDLCDPLSTWEFVSGNER